MKLDKVKIITELTKQEVTQTELAKRIGYNRSFISGVCNGRNCGIRTAKAIAEALGVNVKDLV